MAIQQQQQAPKPTPSPAAFFSSKKYNAQGCSRKVLLETWLNLFNFFFFNFLLRVTRTYKPNVVKKKLYSPTLDKTLQLRVTPHTLRCIDKAGGFDEYVKDSPNFLFFHSLFFLTSLSSQTIFSSSIVSFASPVAPTHPLSFLFFWQATRAILSTFTFLFYFCDFFFLVNACAKGILWTQRIKTWILTLQLAWKKACGNRKKHKRQQQQQHWSNCDRRRASVKKEGKKIKWKKE